MNNEPLVSVVIASYNMANYLPLAVRSALAQTYKHIEVLIVDDGSTDNTGEVAKHLLDDHRVRYIVQQNKGQAVAKNCGIRESSGEFIAFLDADDMWMPEKLDTQIPLFFHSKTLGVVYAKLKYIDEKGKELLERPDNYMLFRGRVSNPLFIRNFIRFGTAVVRRECFDRLGGFKEYLRMGIDYDLWLRFSTQYEFDYVDQPLLCYRVWSGQMSNNCKGRYLNGIEIMKIFLEDFPKLVDKKIQNEAWAHTYVGFGQCLRDVDKKIGPALNLYMRALWHKPTYLPAWRAIVRATLFR